MPIWGIGIFRNIKGVKGTRVEFKVDLRSTANLTGAFKWCSSHSLPDLQHGTSIGQGFADEVFSVWKNDRPTVTIEPVRAADHIIAMIRHAKDE